MDKERFDKGLAQRKAVLGAEYVERSLAQADDFNREFQEIVTEFAWGLCWGDDTLDRRQRSMLHLGMLAALGRMHEFGLHFRGALKNGVSRDELKAILTQITAYCGVPAGVECFRVAREILAEVDAK
jgi:4-carboxymuconolactone decarboxylase